MMRTRTAKEILESVRKVGSFYQNYSFCSYTCATMSYSGDKIEIKHTATVFYKINGSHLNKSITVSDSPNVDHLLKELEYKIKLEFEKHDGKQEDITVDKDETKPGIPQYKGLKKEHFNLINLGVRQFRDGLHEFTWQTPLFGDDNRKAQKSDHVFVNTNVVKYDKPVNNFEEALVIFNREYNPK